MIPVAGPWITEKEIAYVTDAVTHGWYDQANGYIDKFESAFKVYLGRKYAISLPSCTSGLHLSLLALGVGPGDEVIVPDGTWIASAAPVSYVGATPIFADMDSQTWCLSAETVRPLISEKTKAIVAVNLYGHMPNYDPLLALGVPVIEDAAESIGSLYKGKKSGTFGITSCFSFHGSKTLTTGEGGILVTDDEHLYRRCMIARDHGRLPGDTLFQNIEVGHKYKMSNLQAALGLAQLERLDELVQKKREIFSWYHEALEGLEGISLNPDHPDVYNSYWMTTVLWNASLQMTKFDMVQKFKEAGIASRPFFSPLSDLKAYEGAQDTDRAQKENLVAHNICARGVNLPCSASLTEENIKYIVQTLKETIND